MVYQYGDVVSEPMDVVAMRIRDVVLKSQIQMVFETCLPVSSPMMSCETNETSINQRRGTHQCNQSL
jgi:hypothetical protein